MQNELHLPKNQHRFAIAGLLAMTAAFAFAPVSEVHAAGPLSMAANYTATTANMTPSGLQLRIQVITWQEADARTEVVATLAGDDAAALAKLPTVGYVWPKGSPVGYSLKYAHRTATADGRERVTLVTDKRIGSYDYRGWSVSSPSAKASAPYSVIELHVDRAGAGTGSLSLATEIALDESAGTVALADSAPTLLTDVKREATTP